MRPSRDPPQNRRSTQSEHEGMEKIFQTNGHEKKVGVAMLVSDKKDFKTKAIKIDKGHYVVLKRVIYQNI